MSPDNEGLPPEDLSQLDWMTMPWAEFLERAESIAAIISPAFDNCSSGTELVRSLYATVEQFDRTRPMSGERDDPLVVNTTFGNATVVSQLARMGCYAILKNCQLNQHRQN